MKEKTGKQGKPKRCETIDRCGDSKKRSKIRVKVEFTFPPELLNQIVEELFQRVKPLLTTEKHEENNMDVIFDVSRLSEYLCVSPKWIYEQTHLKTIPYFKLGNKQLRFRKKDIDKWLDSLKTPSSARIPLGMQGFSPPKKKVL